MSSWQFYNPLSKKSKDNDEVSLAQQFDESSGLPKRDVMSPNDGYTRDTSKESKVASSSTGRKNSDPMTDLHTAGNGRTSGTNGSDGNSSSRSSSTNTMVSQSNPPLYGTTTPIESGFANSNAGQLTGAPLYPQTGQQFAGSQPMDMTASNAGNPQSSYPYSGANDPVYGGAYGATAMPGSSVTPQMVASNQGMYGNQVPGYDVNQVQAYPFAGTVPQNPTIQNTVPPGYVQQPMATPNGQATSDPTYGINPYGNPAGTGIPNPAAMGTPGYAMGTPGYPMTDPGYGAMQPSPQVASTQATPTSPGQPYPAQQPAQQPASNSYQGGFSYFGPTNDDAYRPGSMY